MKIRSNFTLTQMEYVLSLHRLGHFARAARECQVSQPTLSMQIQKLESDIGVVLFDRSKKPILLTDAGKQVVAQMQTVVFEAQKIGALIESLEKEILHGELRLAVIPTVAPYVLPHMLSGLSKKYPQLRLMIREMQTDRIVEALENDQIDVGLLATPLGRSSIHEHSLYLEPFYLLCASESPLAQKKTVRLQDLDAEEVWLLEEGHCLRNQVLDICSYKKKNKTRSQFEFESGSLETLKKLVASYGGYTLLPGLALEASQAGVKVVEFSRPIPSREIGLVFQRTHYKINLIEALGETLVESLPNHIRKLRRKDLDVLPVG